MKILVLGGTRFFGKHMVNCLLHDKHQVVIATRGNTKDNYGNNVERIIFDRTDANSIADKLANHNFDIVYDNISYASKDVKRLFDNMKVKRYIMTSSASVCNPYCEPAREIDFNPLQYDLKWYDRKDNTYAECKRQAETALRKAYPDVCAIAVRFPFVIGEDDYTKRLLFYIDHIIKGIPIYMDNFEIQMSFISSVDAGRFLAWLATQNYEGAINGASPDTISMKDIISYVENKVGNKAILCADGDKAPYNGQYAHSINTNLATILGFKFTFLNSWIYNLLDNLMLNFDK